MRYYSAMFGPEARSPLFPGATVHRPLDPKDYADIKAEKYEPKECRLEDFSSWILQTALGTIETKDGIGRLKLKHPVHLTKEEMATLDIAAAAFQISDIKKRLAAATSALTK